jgi:hypothetical protein
MASWALAHEVDHSVIAVWASRLFPHHSEMPNAGHLHFDDELHVLATAGVGDVVIRLLLLDRRQGCTALLGAFSLAYGIRLDGSPAQGAEPDQPTGTPTTATPTRREKL